MDFNELDSNILELEFQEAINRKQRLLLQQLLSLKGAVTEESELEDDLVTVHTMGRIRGNFEGMEFMLNLLADLADKLPDEEQSDLMNFVETIFTDLFNDFREE